jgi:hypothetical protein
VRFDGFEAEGSYEGRFVVGKEYQFLSLGLHVDAISPSVEPEVGRRPGTDRLPCRRHHQVGAFQKDLTPDRVNAIADHV